ncbi:hypothetical protein QUF88_12935 [Bacillus sp. DX1.1]|uniref:hypothetical protein n=1 Tax=unclassified Bacillus (in: firmicutes) TaxID=185979 RepID=UPI002570A87D|nr:MULTISPECIES: hypothetical protein [unclassified Bacillus (in: firmicutes)]MDM5154704.1 hypothetical protein [Bacillus sp. DX1.1]WJE83592.1 hypothetical protein QRE67_10430 [Bacillus sp. DX3.1]
MGKEPALATQGTGQHSLKDAYQFMKETGERVFGKGGSKAKNLQLEDFTKEVLKTKPMNSPRPERWLLKQGGKISIDDKGVWTYTNKNEQSVRYPNGYPDFTPYAHPDIPPVTIKVHSPKNNQKDFEAANVKEMLKY